MPPPTKVRASHNTNPAERGCVYSIAHSSIFSKYENGCDYDEMKKFVALLNDGSYVNTYADRMEMKEDLVLVWWEDDLVAILDISVVLVARMDIISDGKR